MSEGRGDRRNILSVDGGSSSMKVAVYELGPTDERKILEADIDERGASNETMRLRDYRDGPPRETRRTLNAESIAAVLTMLGEMGIAVDAVGHRIVFGGPQDEPARVTAELLTQLAALVPADPLHLPRALRAIGDVTTSLPRVPQVACFDTAFHERMPAVAQRLPLPRGISALGVRRYGFHGLSYESIVRELGEGDARGRLIVAHLGNGASLTAILDGRPMDTTMGFTPLGGMMMGTRPGDLDPGVLLYLLRERHYTVEELDAALERDSGLRGVSEISSDMRTLLGRRATSEPAAQAVELFVYQARKFIGALASVLDGLDTLVFTGGIGERAAPVRWEIAQGLGHLGVEIDPARNDANEALLSPDGARVVVRIIETKETLVVARHTFELIFQPLLGHVVESRVVA
ncbi:MAG: acetate/propionate family kinase [Candidatus Tyrphobacter sp.]